MKILGGKTPNKQTPHLQHPSVCTLKLLPDHECQPSLHSAVVGEQLGATYEEIRLVGERLGALLLLAAVRRRDGGSFHLG